MPLTKIQPTANVDVEVKLELADTLRASCAIFARRARTAIVVYGLIVVAVLGFLLMQQSLPGREAGLIWALAPPFVLLPILTLGFVYWANKAQFRRAAHRTMRYHLCPGGLDITSQVRAGWLPWEAFVEALETKSAFILFLSPHEHYVLPKRCFRDAEEIRTVRGLLRQKLESKFRGL